MGWSRHYKIDQAPVCLILKSKNLYVLKRSESSHCFFEDAGVLLGSQNLRLILLFRSQFRSVRSMKIIACVSVKSSLCRPYIVPDMPSTFMVSAIVHGRKYSILTVAIEERNKITKFPSMLCKMATAAYII